MAGEGIRALARDVFIYDLKDLFTQLGGLVTTPSITNANLYAMVEIILIIPSHYFLQTDRGDTLPRDSERLLPGNYFVVADAAISVNNETVVTRTVSRSTGTQLEEFRDQVRERDRRCVVSKRENSVAQFGVWTGFEAAHIFPLAWEKYWRDHNFDQWITLPPEQGGTINSVQNGLLLYGGVHAAFDHFQFSINPDVGISGFCPPKSVLIAVVGRI